MEVLNNKYCKIIYSAKDSFFYVKWLENSDWHLQESQYQKYFEEYVKQVEKYGISNALHDMREATFTISPELQAWTYGEMFPRLTAAGLKKLAMLVSHDLIVSISVEQVMEDGDQHNNLFETRYFEEQQEAIEWILGKLVEISL